MKGSKRKAGMLESVCQPWASVLSQLSTSPVAGVGTPRHLTMITLALMTTVPPAYKGSPVSLMSLENFTLRTLGYRGDARFGAMPMCTARGRPPPDCDAPGRDPRSHLGRPRRLSSSLRSWPVRRWAPPAPTHTQQDVSTPHSAGSHLGSGFRPLPSPQGLASWDSSRTAATPSARNRPKAHPHQALSENHQGHPPVGLPPTPLSVEQRHIKAY